MSKYKPVEVPEIADLERTWELDALKPSPLHRTLSGWVALFPQLEEICPLKIKALRSDRRRLRKLILWKEGIIDKHAHTALAKWVAYEYLKLYDRKKESNLTKSINYFSRLLAACKGKQDPFEDKIEEARGYPILSLVASYGVKLKKAGKEYSGLCPLHSEKSPSFTINEKKNLWYCFGCAKGGGPIDFVMALKNLTFKQAVKEIAG